mgnify:CR=1 FL=1
MKADIHPQYHQAQAHCVCGNEFTVGVVLLLLRDVCMPMGAASFINAYPSAPISKPGGARGDARRPPGTR